MYKRQVSFIFEKKSLAMTRSSSMLIPNMSSIASGRQQRQGDFLHAILKKKGGEKMKKQSVTFASGNGQDSICGYWYEPEGPVLSLIHI